MILEAIFTPLLAMKQRSNDNCVASTCCNSHKKKRVTYGYIMGFASLYNQRELFICLDLMVINRKVSIERYFK
jgi:hypothetical protein